MIRFRVAPHELIPDIEVVEVWSEKGFLGTVSPQPDVEGIRVISKHITGVREDNKFVRTVDIDFR